MGKQRYKVIRAGRLVREVLWTPVFPCDTPAARSGKSDGTSKARTAINLRYSYERLMFRLAANFTQTDLFLTCTYDNEHLPPDRARAIGRIKRFIAQMRGYYREHGQELRYYYNTEEDHGNKRLHHHLVVNRGSLAGDYKQMSQELEGIWGQGWVKVEGIDSYGYEGLAKYFCKEGDKAKGLRNYTPSRNLAKPETEPAAWVPESMSLQLPPGAYGLGQVEKRNQFGHFAYMDYLVPDRLPTIGRTRKKDKG